MKLMTVAAALFAAGATGAGNLVLIGDSTLASRAKDPVKGSWGESLTNSLAPGWQVVNVAVGGRTVMTIQQASGFLGTGSKKIARKCRYPAILPR